MINNPNIDSIDAKILEHLQADASLSVSDIADKIGMTPPPCWRRIRRLREEGILDKQVWLVDPQKVGLGVTVYATVKLVTHDPEATSAFQKAVQVYPQVQECYILLGAIDVLLKVVAKDIEAYEHFFYNHLSLLPGVRAVKSNVMMTEVKKSTQLPVAP